MEGLKESVNLRVTSVSFAWLTRHVIVPPIIKKKKKDYRGRVDLKKRMENSSLYNVTPKCSISLEEVWMILPNPSIPHKKETACPKTT